MAVSRALAALGLAFACAAGAVAIGDVEEARAADPRPNVVILYVDDVNPNAARLWSDISRTPSLAKLRRQGVRFLHAVGATPLCGPSRATLLTGQYGHNNGVTGNGLHNFDPRSTLATKLQGAGYHTILAGKYGNGIERVTPTQKSVWKYARGWSKFDIIWKRPDKDIGRFYKYYLWTRGGVVWKGGKPRDHSTYVVGNRVASYIRKAPRDKPLFALASLSSGHVPNIPLAWHSGSPACRAIQPYRPPSFNERNVTDKPRYIRSLPRLSRQSFGLRSRCEEMLGVDLALAKIRKALRETGRLNDTLLLFTADNGYLLGDHRMPGDGGKRWPHAAPVPLYALWPAELGNQRRTVAEPVSDADLATTICKLADCSLDDPDGSNILPLLKGDAGKLDRRFVYTEMLRSSGGMPAWYGLVTTRAYSTKATYQYVEYATGERELYNLTNDPYRLSNLASKPWQASRVKNLHSMLHSKVVKPDGVKFQR
ncbi:MAG: sulfatase-like hydrolase/transferase [Chloroflexota bacterium]|nr:sulfatase-like hydrolase/transferase [Chloroflexota bacterium]